MADELYRYTFTDAAPAGEVEATLLLALFAVEALPGQDQVRPAEGQRNAPYLALQGGLLRDGLPVEQAEAVVTALLEATGGDEAKYVGGVRRTHERLKADEKVSGWPTLARLLGGRGAAAVAGF